MSCSLCLRARPLFLHGVSLTLSLSKNENSAATQSHVFLYNRLQYHSIICEKASGECKTACQEDSFLWVYYISGKELYSEVVDFSKQSALHCFRVHTCHVLCDRLIFTPTQRKISVCTWCIVFLSCCCIHYRLQMEITADLSLRINISEEIDTYPSPKCLSWKPRRGNSSVCSQRHAPSPSISNNPCVSFAEARSLYY